MKRILHTLALAAGTLAALLAIYRLAIGPIPWSALAGGGVDAVSGASVILDAPSGNYVVLLNRDAHAKLDTADAGGFQMADSYRSRLPENQMTLRAESAAMMLSRAELGRFDVIVMSKEFAEAFRADTAYAAPGVQVIEVGGDVA